MRENRLNARAADWPVSLSPLLTCPPALCSCTPPPRHFLSSRPSERAHLTALCHPDRANGVSERRDLGGAADKVSGKPLKRSLRCGPPGFAFGYAVTGRVFGRDDRQRRFCGPDVSIEGRDPLILRRFFVGRRQTWDGPVSLDRDPAAGSANARTRRPSADWCHESPPEVGGPLRPDRWRGGFPPGSWNCRS